ncbi:MAG: DegT/DnrJ/EryC1/StrS family aminotransferase [Pseudomonadota bacterium]|nr:DegT/DnrJ/EryC1/StrS family aminotransferase [Pseudomonadota bacterium]
MKHIDSVINKIKSCLIKRESYQVHEPIFPKNTKKVLSDCIDSTYVSTKGKYIIKFQNEIKKLTKSKYILLTNTGTSALTLSLSLSNVENCEVLVPTMTFVATPNSVFYAKGIPHFIDSGKEDLNIDSIKLDKYLDKITIIKKGKCINKKTRRIIKSIIVVHSYGYPADMPSIIKVCKKYNISIIEDAAGALGSFLNKKHLGTFSKFGVLSFNGNKTITTGMGGALMINNKNDYIKLNHLISTARLNHKWSIQHDEIGFNLRMSNLNAALGYAQIKDIKNTLKCKKKLYNSYVSQFIDDKICHFLPIENNSQPNYWLTNIFLNKKYIKDHQQLIRMFHKKNIFVRELWTPQHLLPMYSNNPRSDLSNAVNHWKSGISLPSSYY